jgi:hypothetical protein
VTLKEVIVAPALLLAVTVYTVTGERCSGVPERAPVEVSKVNPRGSVGAMLKDAMAPPLALGAARAQGSLTVQRSAEVA